jgi:hypothetical protein
MFFDEKIDVRLRSYEKIAVKQIIKEHPEKFDNLSHFGRAAILKFIRTFKQDYDKEVKLFEVRELKEGEKIEETS